MVTVEVRGDQIHLRAPYEMRDVCRALSRRWDPELKAWVAPATATAASMIQAALGHLIAEPSPLRSIAVRRPPDVAGDLAPISATRTPLWRHQLQAHWHARRIWDGGHPGALLAMEMATGKTLAAISLVAELRAPRVLVVCPDKVAPVWPAQFELHAPGVARVFSDDGPLAERAAAVDAFLAGADGRPSVVVTNYESIVPPKREPAASDPRAEKLRLRRLSMSSFAECLADQRWDMVILDEIHRIKGAGGSRSRWLARLADRVPRRLGLSGTPASNSPLDFYGIFRFLDKGIFGTSLVEFRSRYAVTGQYPSQIVAWVNQDELQARVASITFRVMTDDVLDLPPVVTAERFFDLEAETARVYRELRDEMVAWVRGGVEVTAENALSKCAKLRQVTGGFVRPSAGAAPVRIGQEKARLLADVLGEIDARDPVVVFCEFHPDLDAVREAAAASGREALELSGRRNDVNAAEWSPPSPGAVLAVQTLAGGEGISLARSRHVVFFDLPWAPGAYDQAVARLRRPGQEGKSVVCVHLVARGTVDVLVSRALQKKRRAIDAVLHAARGGKEEADGR